MDTFIKKVLAFSAVLAILSIGIFRGSLTHAEDRSSDKEAGEDRIVIAGENIRCMEINAEGCDITLRRTSGDRIRVYSTVTKPGKAEIFQQVDTLYIQIQNETIYNASFTAEIPNSCGNVVISGQNGSIRTIGTTEFDLNITGDNISNTFADHCGRLTISVSRGNVSFRGRNISDLSCMLDNGSIDAHISVGVQGRAMFKTAVGNIDVTISDSKYLIPVITGNIVNDRWCYPDEEDSSGEMYIYVGYGIINVRPDS